MHAEYVSFQGAEAARAESLQALQDEVVRAFEVFQTEEAEETASQHAEQEGALYTALQKYLGDIEVHRAKLRKGATECVDAVVRQVVQHMFKKIQALKILLHLLTKYRIRLLKW